MKSKLFLLWSLITIVLLAYAVYEAAFHAPLEKTMFEAQRIFYYHVPAAATSFGLFIMNCIASIIYLWKRSPRADALAVAGAEVGVVFCGVVLITGPIWAKYAWGTYWVWDARLTTTLLLWLLYMSYLILRKSSDAGSTSVLAAALAQVAVLNGEDQILRIHVCDHSRDCVGLRLGVRQIAPQPDQVGPAAGLVGAVRIVFVLAIGIAVSVVATRGGLRQHGRDNPGASGNLK